MREQIVIEATHLARLMRWLSEASKKEIHEVADLASYYQKNTPRVYGYERWRATRLIIEAVTGGYLTLDLDSYQSIIDRLIERELLPKGWTHNGAHLIPAKNVYKLHAVRK